MTLIGIPDPTTFESLIVINPSLLNDVPYPWTNYEAIGTGRISNSNTGGKDLAIVVRYVDPNNYYWLGLGLWNHKWGIGRMLNGVAELLTSDGVDNSDTEIVQGQTYVIKAVANGNTLELWVNGAQVLTFTDSNFAGGSIGFRSFNTTVEWDNLNVNPLNITPRQNLTVTSTVGGITDPTGTNQYPQNTNAMVAAIADNGYRIADWILDDVSQNSQTGTFTVYMDTDHMLQAVFEQIPPDIYLNINGSLYGTTTPPSGLNGPYALNQIVQLTATPINGYNFSHWILDGVNVGAITSIVMDATHTLTPVFVSAGFNWLPLLLASAGAVGAWYIIK